MKNFLIACLLLLGSSAAAFSQNIYFTKDGFIKFYSSTPVEDIEATNNKVVSFMKKNTGDIVFAVPIRSFQFEKSLMQDHFNEKYMETDKYPEAKFQGKIVNIKDVNFDKDGVYKVTVEGDLTMHGVTKHRKVEGTLEVKGDQIMAKSVFMVKLADHKIRIPSIVNDHIATQVQVTVEMNYKPHETEAKNG